MADTVPPPQTKPPKPGWSPIDWYRELGILPKIALWIVVLSPVLLAGAYFVGKPAYKQWKQANALKMADEYAREGNMKGASLAFRKAIRANPDNVEVWEKVCDFLDQNGSPDVVGVRAQIVRLKPDDISAEIDYLQSAVKYKRRALARQLIADFPQSHAGDPRFLQAKGVVLADYGRKAEALEALQKAYEQNPDLPDLALQLSVAKIASEDALVRAEGLDALREMSKQPDENGAQALRELIADAARQKDMLALSVYSNRLAERPGATLRDRLIRTDFEISTNSLFAPLAIEELKRYGEKNPEMITPIANYLIGRGRLAEAKNWIATLPEEIQRTAGVQAAKFEVAVGSRDWDTAFSVLRDGIGEVPISSEAIDFAQRALELHHTDDPEASATWSRALGLVKGSIPALNAFAKLARSQDWPDGLLQADWALVEVQPQRSEIWLEMIGMEKDRGNLSGVYQAISGALRGMPDEGSLRSNWVLVSVLLNKGNPADLLESASKIYEMAPQDPFTITAYAMALHNAGQFEAAANIINELSESDKQLPERSLYEGVIYASASMPDEAREALARAEPQLPRMLPEENVLYVSTLASLDGRNLSEDEIQAQIEENIGSEESKAALAESLRADRERAQSGRSTDELMKQFESEMQNDERSPEDMQRLIETIRGNPAGERNPTGEEEGSN